MLRLPRNHLWPEGNPSVGESTFQMPNPFQDPIQTDRELCVNLMKNNECEIRISLHGHVLQTYKRENDSWVQISSNGTKRQCTAEQLLSHILPPLAGVSPSRVEVVRISGSSVLK